MTWLIFYSLQIISDELNMTMEALEEKVDEQQDKLSSATALHSQQLQSQSTLLGDFRQRIESLEAEVKTQHDALLHCTECFKTTTTAASTTTTEATTTTTIIKDGTVRLVGGGNQYEGRVEVSYNGEYGTVCDDGWADSEAQVVCRMLGYTGGTGYHGQGSPSSYGPQHNYGAGTGEILLTSVDCRGDEGSLFSCRHPGIGAYNCDHREDAGVRCDP